LYLDFYYIVGYLVHGKGFKKQETVPNYIKTIACGL